MKNIVIPVPDSHLKTVNWPMVLDMVFNRIILFLKNKYPLESICIKFITPISFHAKLDIDLLLASLEKIHPDIAIEKHIESCRALADKDGIIELIRPVHTAAFFHSISIDLIQTKNSFHSKKHHVLMTDVGPILISSRYLLLENDTIDNAILTKLLDDLSHLDRFSQARPNQGKLREFFGFQPIPTMFPEGKIIDKTTLYRKDIMKKWPILKTSDLGVTYIYTEVFYNNIGTIPVNDYGPNHTSHGFHTSIRDESESKKIVILGGSFAYSVNLHPKDSFAVKIKNFLEKKSTEACDVIDLACPGDSLLDQGMKLLQMIDTLKPKSVVALAGVNEIANQYKFSIEANDVLPMRGFAKFGAINSEIGFRNHSPMKAIRNAVNSFRFLKALADQFQFELQTYCQPWPDFTQYSQNSEFIIRNYYEDSMNLQRVYDMFIEYAEKKGIASPSLVKYTDQLMKSQNPHNIFIDKCHGTPILIEKLANIIAGDLTSA